MAIQLKVNGKTRAVTAEPDTPLLYVRRLSVDQHGAGAALREPAAEFGAIKFKVVAKQTGCSMRLLHQRNDHDRKGAPRSQSEAVRSRGTRRTRYQSLP